jgi:glycerol-3-phosphate dehydrogenase
MMLTSSRSRRNLRIATAISFTGCAIALTSRSNRETSRSISLRYDANGKAIAPSFPKLKSREAQIKALKQSALDPNEEYDLLVVGGGATGTGVALDAVTRGLKVALVDANDFASGTSSKSTKLIHGGVRYLEKAFWELDYSQYANNPGHWHHG